MRKTSVTFRLDPATLRVLDRESRRLRTTRSEVARAALLRQMAVAEFAPLTARNAPRPPAVETFPNPAPRRAYEIRIEVPEFTSVCPKTGQPDFGTIRIVYVPARACLELKSLKMYFQSYRNRGIFYEAAVNAILDDLVRACRPRRMEVSGSFTPRGGIATTVVARHG
jgi:7-cyano-7-deazaguanine reductase